MPGHDHDPDRQRDKQGGLHDQQDGQEPGQAGQRSLLAAMQPVGPAAHHRGDGERGQRGYQHALAPPVRVGSAGRACVRLFPARFSPLDHADRVAVRQRQPDRDDRGGQDRRGQDDRHPPDPGRMTGGKNGDQRHRSARGRRVELTLPADQRVPPPEARFRHRPGLVQPGPRDAGPGLVLARGRDADPPEPGDDEAGERQGQGDPPTGGPGSVPAHPVRQQQVLPVGRLPGHRAHGHRGGRAHELDRGRHGQQPQQRVRDVVALVTPQMRFRPLDDHGLAARHGGRQHEVGDVVHHERGQQQPGCRRQRRLGQPAPRVRLQLPRHARLSRTVRAPPPEKPGRGVARDLQGLRVLQHGRAVGSRDAVNAQLGDLLSGHRGVGQGTGLARQCRAGLVGRRITPRRVETKHHHVRAFRAGWRGFSGFFGWRGFFGSRGFGHEASR